MIRGVNIAITCIIFALLQMLVAPRIAIGNVSPDFMLLLVAYFAIDRKAEQGAMVGFLVGLFQDLFNPELLGLNALTKSVVGYGLSVAGSKTRPDNPLLMAALVMAAALANDLLYLLFFTGLHLGKTLILWTTVSVPSAVYTALMGIVVYKLASVLGSKAVRHLGKARS